MIRKITLAAAAALVVAFAAVDVQASPIAPPLSGAGAFDLTLVAQGCGVGRHRGPDGVCRRNAPKAVVVVPAAPAVVVAPAAPVVVVKPKVCPRGFHRNRRGVCVAN
jgi:hypothetical protein